MGMSLCLMPWSIISWRCFWFRPVLPDLTLSSIVMVIERKCIKRAFKLCWLLKSRVWTSDSWVGDVLLFDALMHDSQMLWNVLCYLSLNRSQKTFPLERLVTIEQIALCCALQSHFLSVLKPSSGIFMFQDIYA